MALSGTRDDATYFLVHFSRSLRLRMVVNYDGADEAFRYGEQQSSLKNLTSTQVAAGDVQVHVDLYLTLTLTLTAEVLGQDRV